MDYVLVKVLMLFKTLCKCELHLYKLPKITKYYALKNLFALKTVENNF